MSIIRALGSSVAGNFFSLVINFLTVVVASRYLEPSDVGAYAVSFTLITVVSTLIEANTQNYLVKTGVVNRKSVALVRGILVAHSVFALIVIIVFINQISYVLARVDFLAVKEVLIWIIPTIAIIPFYIPESGLLRRDFKYYPLMISSVLSSLVRLIVSFYMLNDGKGVYSLAFSFLASKIIEAIVVLFFIPGYIKLIPTFMGAKNAYAFIFPTTISQAAGTIGFAASEIAVGHYLGLHAAGLFNRANALTSIYRTAVEKAVVPIYYATVAKLVRDNSDHAAKGYLKTQKLMSVVGWPAFGFLYIEAANLVEIFFGNQWIDVVTTVKILSVACSLYILCATTSSVLMALAKTKIMIIREFFVQIIRIFVVIWATNYGVEGVAVAILFAYALNALFDGVILHKIFGIGGRAIFFGLAPSLFIAIFCATLLYFLENMLIIFNVDFALRLFLGGVICATVWIFMIMQLKHDAAIYIKAAVNKCRK